MRRKCLATRSRSSRVERGHRCVEFVQQLLEPQLVNLMDDDEEHLVVVRGAGERLLQGEQLVDF